MAYDILTQCEKSFCMKKYFSVSNGSLFAPSGPHCLHCKLLRESRPQAQPLSDLFLSP